MKKFISLILPLFLTACAQAPAESEKIKITASLFPQYDFARIIGGDKAEAALLLAPGQESHLYDPSPNDMKEISQSDLFIFTGDAMEGWASDIASSVGSDVTVLDVSQGITYAEEEDKAHSHSLDPHIWLDFDNAKIMCENICSALSSLSPENADYFRQNCDSLTYDLSELDEEYKNTFASSDKTLVFGGRFALGYLVRRYDINCISAYDSCGSEAEPSLKAVRDLSDYVAENNVKAVYCEEMSDPKVARTIAGSEAEVLVLHSAENTSLEEREEGVTFVSLMRQNLENLRKGLE